MRIDYGSNVVQEKHKHGAIRTSTSFSTQRATESGENTIVEPVKDEP